MADPSDDPRVRSVLRRQHGLIRRSQALKVGLEADQVRRLIASGQWRPVRRGLYTPQALWQELDERVGRPTLEVRAASMAMLRPHVISHDSAALLLGLPTLHQPRRLVHVTRLGAPRAVTKHGIKRHHAPVVEEYVEEVAGLATLGLGRTAVDLAREHGLTHGLVAIDAARQLGVGLAELWSATEPMWHWPNVVTARTAISRSHAGAESVGETLMRMLVEELDLGPVETQFEIRDGTRWARCDLRVGRHLFEFDGHTKYLRCDQGGVAVIDPDRVVWEEKQRQDWLLGYQLGMSRLVWSDFWGDRRRASIERVSREYALTVARFGTSIDDLAHLVVRGAA
jgi:hypothetical protein